MSSVKHSFAMLHRNTWKTAILRTIEFLKLYPQVPSALSTTTQYINLEDAHHKWLWLCIPSRDIRKYAEIAVPGKFWLSKALYSGVSILILGHSLKGSKANCYQFCLFLRYLYILIQTALTFKAATDFSKV